MKAAITAAVLVLGCGGKEKTSTTPGAGQASKSGGGNPMVADAVSKADANVPQGEIVTAEMEKMNSEAFGRPPTTFQKGNPRPIPIPKAAKTATGFQVQFASHATITTPTVYEREVIVSGGFQGKELYAYETQTGKQIWGIDLGDDGPSSPACERGVCVVSTESCTIFAVDAKTGKHLWSYWLGDPLTSAPSIAGDRVFASYPAGSAEGGKERPPNANHALAAFDLKTGKILWQKWLDADVMSAPVAVGEFVYVTTFNGTVIKFEQSTGKIRYAMRAKATSAPVIQFDDKGVESMYYTRKLEAASPADAPEEAVIRADHNEPKTKYEAAKKKADYIDRKTQEKSAHQKESSDNDAANGFGDGAPASAAANYAADSVGIANVSSMQGWQGSRVVHLRDRNVNTMGDEVIATDAENGNTLWSYKLSGNMQQQGGFLGTAPLAAGSSILLATLDGKVLRLDQKSGKQTATYAVGGPVRSQPVVADGWIYVGTEDGKLVAIDTKDKSVTGWPTWGGNAQRTGIAKY